MTVPRHTPLYIWIRKRPFWWSAINPDESLALMDTHTTVRARSREDVIEKARRYWGPQESPWEEIEP